MTARRDPELDAAIARAAALPPFDKAAFIARCRQARKRAGFTVEAMADELGIEPSEYARYETSALLPHVHVVQFCDLTEIYAGWLFRR